PARNRLPDESLAAVGYSAFKSSIAGPDHGCASGSAASSTETLKTPILDARDPKALKKAEIGPLKSMNPITTRIGHARIRMTSTTRFHATTYSPDVAARL